MHTQGGPLKGFTSWEWMGNGLNCFSCTDDEKHKLFPEQDAMHVRSMVHLREKMIHDKLHLEIEKEEKKFLAH